VLGSDPKKGVIIEPAKGCNNGHDKLKTHEMEGSAMIPRGDYVELEQYGDAPAFLAHKLTRERHALPDGIWSLATDDEGWAMAEDRDGNIVLAKDGLQRALCKTSADPLLIRDMATSSSGKLWTLSCKMHEAEEISVTMLAGSARALHLLKCYNLVWPRAGTKVVWIACSF